MALAWSSFITVVVMFLFLKVFYPRFELLKNIYILKTYLIFMCAFIGLMIFAMFQEFGVGLVSIMFAVLFSPIVIGYIPLVMFSKEATIKNIVQTRFVAHYDNKLWYIKIHITRCCCRNQ